MQPAPKEASQNANTVELSQDQPPHLHHGLQDLDEPASGHLSAGARELRSAPPTDSDALSVSSTSTSRGRQVDTSRLSARGDSSHSSSPGSRIDDYERKHAKPRKRSDGMIFQVVPSKDRDSNVAIEEFPNGT